MILAILIYSSLKNIKIMNYYFIISIPISYTTYEQRILAEEEKEKEFELLSEPLKLKDQDFYSSKFDDFEA